jgi:hypothetical protein
MGEEGEIRELRHNVNWEEFGTFPLKEIPSFIKKNITASPRELRQSFRAWVKQYLTESLH